MARLLYGASAADYVVNATTGIPQAGVTVTIYTAVSGGSQVTDLLNSSQQAVTTVTTDSAGGFRFYGPDGTTATLWASTGGGTRYAVQPATVSDLITTNGVSAADFAAHTADPAAHGTHLTDLVGVSVSGPKTGDQLVFTGSSWVNGTNVYTVTYSDWFEAHLGADLSANATYYPISTRNEPGDIIRLRGTATADAAWSDNAVLFTVVEAHRPEKPVVVVATCDEGATGGDAVSTVRLLIGTDGTATVLDARTTGALLSVDGQSYSKFTGVVIQDVGGASEATGATQGAPGTWTPAGSIPPADYTELAAEITASPSSLWSPGNYVTAVDGTEWHWNGSAWTSGRSPIGTSGGRFYADPGPGKWYLGAQNGFGSIADLESDLAGYTGASKTHTAERIYNGSPSSLTAANNIDLDTGTRSDVNAALTAGRLPIVTSKWYAAGRAAILAGDADAKISSLATYFKSKAPDPIWFVPWHEMAEDFANAADYVSVFRYIVLKLKSLGCTNVAYGWCPTGTSFHQGAADPASSCYPGDDVVDVIGADGYNFYTDLGYPSLSGPDFNANWRDGYSIYNDALTFAEAHGKPFFVGELGTPSATDLTKVQGDWKTTSTQWGDANLNSSNRTLAQINDDWWTGTGGVATQLAARNCVAICYWSSGGNSSGFTKSWNSGTYSLTRRGSDKYSSPYAVATEASTKRAQQWVTLLNGSAKTDFDTVLGGATPPPSTTTPVIRAVATGKASATTLTLTFPTDDQLGQGAIAATDHAFLFAAIRKDTPTWTTPSGWTVVADTPKAGNSIAMVSYRKKLTAGDLSTGTVAVTTGSGTNPIAAVLVVVKTGTIHDTDPLDLTGDYTTSAGNSTSMASTAGTADHGQSRLFAAYCQIKSANLAEPSFSAPSGMALAGSAFADSTSVVQVKLAVYSAEQTASGAVAAKTAVSDTYNHWISQVVAARSYGS